MAKDNKIERGSKSFDERSSGRRRRVPFAPGMWWIAGAAGVCAGGAVVQHNQ